MWIVIAHIMLPAPRIIFSVIALSLIPIGFR